MWAKEAELSVPGSKALPRVNLLLVGCLTEGRGGEWRLTDSSGSVRCEVSLGAHTCGDEVKGSESKQPEVKLSPSILSSCLHLLIGSVESSSSLTGTTSLLMLQGRKKRPAVWKLSHLLCCSFLSRDRSLVLKRRQS